MITQDDILYMIVTDRFANGDPTNDADVDRLAPDRRHGGDLLGIVQRMPYLSDLGVTALWATPVYRNPPEAYHGYHPFDFEHVDPHLCSPQLGPVGSREVIRHFVQIAHQSGFKVIFDAVVCHTAKNHPWQREHPDWYNVNSPIPEKWWIWGLPDLNHDNLDVNTYFVRNVLEWMHAGGFDGLRIDATRHVEKQFWQMFKPVVQGLYPNLTVIGEVWNAAVAEVAPYQAYHGFDSMFDYPLYHAIVDVFACDQGFARIARPELTGNEPQGILNQDEEYRNAFRLVTFIGNHDTPRFLSLAMQEGRREKALARTKLALAFLFTTRGIPQLYYGDELAMEGGPQPDNRQDMPWNWVEDVDRHSMEIQQAREMVDFTRSLIQLRKASKALRYGVLTTLYLTPTLYAFARIFLDEVCIVVLNNAWEAADVTIPIHVNSRLPRFVLDMLPNGLGVDNWIDPHEQTQVTDGSLRLHLPAKSAAVYRIVASPLQSLGEQQFASEIQVAQ